MAKIPRTRFLHLLLCLVVELLSFSFFTNDCTAKLCQPMKRVRTACCSWKQREMEEVCALYWHYELLARMREDGNKNWKI